MHAENRTLQQRGAMERRHAERGMRPVRDDRHVLHHQQKLRPSVSSRGGLQSHLTAGTENEDEEDESVDLDNVMIGPQPPPVPPVVYSEALIDKLRECIRGTPQGSRNAKNR